MDLPHSIYKISESDSDSEDIEDIRRILRWISGDILDNNRNDVRKRAFFMNVDDFDMLGWLGAIAYTLQIFFDFSDYSNMAIGLGRMFGFHFLENFDYPYISISITEFWRRWHMSLGTWFCDYLYFLLSGSRCSSRGIVDYRS